MKKIEYLLLLVIVALALVVRLYKINRPLADWHSWRQADTASVARNFIKDGYNPFIPKFDDMSSQANGLDNPNRYRFVEFPIYNSLIASVWSIWGINTTSARLVTVFITLFSTVFLYFLVKHFSGILTAALAAFFFAILPYNIFYSSAILPGPLMVLGVLGLYFSFAKWMEKEKIGWAVLSIFFANLAILTWPIAILFMLPVIYLAFAKYKLEAFKKISLWVFVGSCLAPFIAWRLWIAHFPEGIPNWRFLINEGNIRFKGAFFRWLIVERLGKLILTLGGFVLLTIGVLKKPTSREKLFYYSYLASVALYFTVFASGNVRHDYYQVPAVPVLCIFMALGVKALFNLPANYFAKTLALPVILASVVSIIAFGYYEVKGYYWINKPQIIKAGQAVDRLLPKDATIIVPYNGDAAFLYATNRRGYPITDKPLEKFIDQGTKYLVSVDVGDAGIQNLARHCKVLEQTGDYVIVEMFKECIGK